MTPYVVDPDSPCIYDLVAIIIHTGFSHGAYGQKSQGGVDHYVIARKGVDGKWYWVDCLQNVQVISFDTIRKCRATMIFYVCRTVSVTYIYFTFFFIITEGSDL
jgi:hypothetical protein